MMYDDVVTKLSYQLFDKTKSSFLLCQRRSISDNDPLCHDLYHHSEELDLFGLSVDW